MLRVFIALVAGPILLASCNLFGANPATYTATYHGNGSDIGMAPVDGNEYEAGDTVTVLGNPGRLNKSGVLFNGWNTAPDGTNRVMYAPWAP